MDGAMNKYIYVDIYGRQHEVDSEYNIPFSNKEMINQKQQEYGSRSGFVLTKKQAQKIALSQKIKLKKLKAEIDELKVKP